MSHTPKKIVIFSVLYLPEYVGGAEVAIDQITKQKELDQYEFHMITLGESGRPSHKVGNIMVHYTGMLGKTGILFTLSKFFYIIACVYKYFSLQKKYAFDLVWPLMAGYGGLAAFFVKILEPKQKLLLTIQEGDTVKHIMSRAMLSWPFYKGLFVKADSIQVISKFLKMFSLDILGKTEDEKIVIIPNGVDLESFAKEVSPEKRTEVRAQYGFQETDIVVVTTSRLTEKNGVDTLIDTMAILPPEYKLLIIGAGPDEDMLKAKVVQKGLSSRVTFAGRKPYEELYMYLKSSDVFARLSRSEGFGNSFIEAMAAELPTIGTDVGGIVDFLQDGVTGYVVTPQNEDLAKQAILRASVKDKTIIANAKRLVQEKYSWNTVAQQFDELFKKII